MVIMVNVEGFKPYVDKSLLGHLIFVWTPKLLENKALNPGMCLYRLLFIYVPIFSSLLFFLSFPFSFTHCSPYVSFPVYLRLAIDYYDILLEIIWPCFRMSHLQPSFSLDLIPLHSYGFYCTLAMPLKTMRPPTLVHWMPVLAV